ncbi:arsenate reductase [Litorivivens lipolytica]|uniref:Arsenate reductase n=1 Tax=Litorivivens lipolytica TaxID=1524264 RepID=A0A7W4W699_9GAMM|nr:arsenate reductase ArsC [Litorivivens lipolytica]MBB3048220.1 arsenate reductase [Litorivivens lipolytica]
MKILFICTHNRCRSILSEAITNQNARGLLEAKSAGSQPAGEVHPLSLRYLQQRGYATEGLQSQSWDDFEAYAPDLVITVCDSAAGESCPVYFGKSLKVHWGLEDPSKVDGSETEKEQAFMACIDEIERRVSKLATLAVEQHDRESLRNALAALGAQ